MRTNIISQACDILRLENPSDKAAAALNMRTAWLNSDREVPLSDDSAPDKPSRPSKPDLVAPRDVP